MRELPLRELAHPALERLARATGESAQLFVRDGDRRICVDAVDSDHELRTIVDVGSVLPLNQGSAGKVFLAWGPPIEQDDVDRLAQQLATTRRRGWADSFGERAPVVASVSAPVFGPGNELLAAISVSGPASRIAPAPSQELRAGRHPGGSGGGVGTGRVNVRIPMRLVRMSVRSSTKRRPRARGRRVRGRSHRACRAPLRTSRCRAHASSRAAGPRCAVR